MFVVARSGTLQILLSWLPATYLAVSAFVGEQPAGAQAADTARVLEYRGFSFASPGPDWQPIDDASATSPLQKKQVVMVRHQEPLHQQNVHVYELEAAAALSPAEITTLGFEAERKTSVAGGRWEWSQPTTRNVNRVTYPVMAGRLTPDGGTPILDALELVYFPLDFDERHRYFWLDWTDTHSATVSAKDTVDFDALVSSVTVRPVGPCCCPTT